MKRLFLIAKVVLATFCISSVALGANIKVVCKSDPKHDRAKLIQAMKTARSGDKIVIIGTCLPRGIQASTRRAYRPNLIKVEIFEATRPQQYDSWKFDREIIYSPLFDTPLPRTVIIDNSRRNVRTGVSSGVTRSTGIAPSRSSAGVKATSTRSTTTTTTSKTTQKNGGANSEDKEQAKDEQIADEVAPEENANTHEEAAPEENADTQEESAPEVDTQEEAAPDDSSDTQSDVSDDNSDGDDVSDGGDDSGDDGGSDSSDDGE